MTEFTEWRSLVDGERISAIPDNLVDNFELSADVDGADEPFGPYLEGDDLSTFYSGDLGDFERTDSSPTIEGDFSVHISSSDTLDSAAIISTPGDELPRYPDLTEGETIRVSLDQIDSDGAPLFVFEAQDANNAYYCGVRPSSGWFRIFEVGGDGLIVDESVSLSNEKHDVEVARNEDDIEYQVFDSDGNSVHSGSVTANEHKGERGVGWSSATPVGDSVGDNYRVLD